MRATLPEGPPARTSRIDYQADEPETPALGRGVSRTTGTQYAGWATMRVAGTGGS